MDGFLVTDLQTESGASLSLPVASELPPPLSVRRSHRCFRDTAHTPSLDSFCLTWWSSMPLQCGPKGEGWYVYRDEP